MNTNVKTNTNPQVKTETLPADAGKPATPSQQTLPPSPQQQRMINPQSLIAALKFLERVAVSGHEQDEMAQLKADLRGQQRFYEYLDMRRQQQQSQ